MEEKMIALRQIETLMQAQEKALLELRSESEELYQAAVQVDLNLVPFHAEGPTATPPINKYESPDGEYVNISKNWD